MFPVGLVTQLGVSSPIIKNGKVVGFYDGWIADRKFPVDMAGFAVNVQFYIKVKFPFNKEIIIQSIYLFREIFH